MDNIKPIKKRTNSTRGDTDKYHLEFTANSEINRRESGPMNGGGDDMRVRGRNVALCSARNGCTGDALDAEIRSWRQPARTTGRGIVFPRRCGRAATDMPVSPGLNGEKRPSSWGGVSFGRTPPPNP
jgi:hypothetical protein